MTATSLPEILKLRLLVGYLGERAQHAWWPTAFYETSSRLFLEPVFSRTSRLAQYHGVLEAARRVHDEHLSVGSYHLFRLPEEVEEDLHALVQRSAADEFIAQRLGSKDAASTTLKDSAGPANVAGIGPVAIGKIAELDSPETVRAIAAAYLSAFDQGQRTYPYLAG